MFTIEGHVELQLKDAVTGEIIETREHKNQLSYATMLAYMEQGLGFGPYVAISSDQSVPRQDDIFLRVAGETLMKIGVTPPSVTSPSYTPATQSTPPTAQFVGRFAVPDIGTFRTIWSIMLVKYPAEVFEPGPNGFWYNTTQYEPSSHTFGRGFYPYVQGPPFVSNPIYSDFDSITSARLKLDIPCIQTDTQVLDVYYRIKFILPAPNTTSITDSGLDWMIKRLSGQPSPWFDYVHSNWCANWPESGLSLPGLKVQPFLPSPLSGADGLNSFTSGNSNRWDHPSGAMPDETIQQTTNWFIFKRNYTFTESLTVNIGRVLGTIHYGDVWANSTVAWHPVLPTTISPNVKIQPIHNHSADAVSPFIDIDKLALGQGTIVATNDSWPNKDYPELYRVQIVTDGEPNGTASYTLFKRNHFGFAGNNYRERLEILPWFSANPVNVFEKNHFDKNFHKLNITDIQKIIG